jgi:hypothetical protein
MSKVGFLDPRDVEQIAKEQPILTPAQQIVSDAASEAIREVEDIFNGGTFEWNGKKYERSNLLSENVEFVLDLLRETGLSREELRDRILATKPGEYFLAQNKAFFMTADFKCQEAAAYVNRLEKATIAAHRQKDLEVQKNITATMTIQKVESRLAVMIEELEKRRNPRSFLEKVKDFFALLFRV